MCVGEKKPHKQQQQAKTAQTKQTKSEHPHNTPAPSTTDVTEFLL